MARVCPVCGNNPVTKPALGMCNVCWYQEHGARTQMAQQNAENKAIHAKIQRRLQMKRDVAEGLRQLAAQAKNAEQRALLARAAIIADDQDPLLYDDEVVIAPSVPEPGLREVFEEVLTPVPVSDVVIVHGGTE